MQISRSTRVLALVSVLLLVLGLGVARCELEPRTAVVRAAAATSPAVPVERDPLPRQRTAITTTTQPALPPTTAHHAAPQRARRSTSKPSSSSGHWHPGGPCPSPSQCPQLRECENSSSYGHGTSPGFDGAYQFDHGSPWGMSPAQQDARADAMYADRGADPWPTCGRYLR